MNSENDAAGRLKIIRVYRKAWEFSNTVREAALLPGQVNAAIKRLEHEPGIRLFARSTLSLRLTGEGMTYLPSAITALEALAQGQERLQGQGNELWLFGQQKIAIKGLLLSDGADTVRLWAIAGEGIAYKSWLDVREDVLGGRLESILEN